MQRFTTRKKFSVAKLVVILMALIIIVPSVDALAQEKKKKKKVKHFEIRIGLTTTYDDNILKYSDKYLDRFMNGEDPGRFHIETYDDLIFAPSVEGIYKFNIFKKVKTRLNANFSPRYYVVNDVKNWLSWSVGIQQYITKTAYIKVLYSYIPEFYVRHFRDDAWVDAFGYVPKTFKPYVFSKDNFGAYIQNTFFKKTRVRLLLYHARYYHNQWYTEYDSKDWLYGIKVYQKLHKNFTLEGAYTYYTSDAKGYDAAYQTPETSTGPDATFVEDRFRFGFDWKFPKVAKRSNNLTVYFNFIKRYYSSPFTPIEDPLHAGRVDANYRMYSTYNIYVIKSLRLSVFYNLLLRDSHTESPINSNYVSNEKDYSQNQVGIRIKYYIRF